MNPRVFEQELSSLALTWISPQRAAESLKIGLEIAAAQGDLTGPGKEQQATHASCQPRPGVTWNVNLLAALLPNEAGQGLIV